MELNIIIDPGCEEKIIVYAHTKSNLVADIERLVSQNTKELIGYSGAEAFLINPDTVSCFSVESGTVFAICENNKYRLKNRLYQIESGLPSNFVKINQSCIANIKRIERFDAGITGTLKVIFKNGHKDYVSRRQLKSVKERIGI